MSVQLDSGVPFGLLGMPTWNTMHVSLQAEAIVIDKLGTTTRLTSNALDILRPTNINLSVVSAAPGELSVSVRSLQDGNGTSSVAFRWLAQNVTTSSDGTPIFRINNLATVANYTLINADWTERINRLIFPYAEVTHYDGLGFISRHTVGMRHILPQVSVAPVAGGQGVGGHHRPAQLD